MHPSISTCWYNKCVFIDTGKHFGLIKLFLLVTSPWEKIYGFQGHFCQGWITWKTEKYLKAFLRCVFMCEYMFSVFVLCVICVLCVCVLCVLLYVCLCCVFALSVCACAVCVVCCMCVPMPLLLEDKRQIYEVILFPSLLVSNVSHRLSGWLGKCLCQMSNLANCFLSRV